MKRILLGLAASVVFSAVIDAQALATEQPIVPLQDNSFLLEEAYNQEAGVVQHIFSMQRGDHHALSASFGQEWPLGGQRHQFSYEIPLVRGSGAGNGLGLGDIVVDYRLQAIGDGQAKLAIAPRLSLNVPSGRGDRGRGSYGFGFGIPISYAASSAIVTHTNLAVLHIPGARDESGRTGNAEYTIAQSVIHQTLPQMHLMLEAVWTGGDADSFIISPGVRFALNFKSGLQIVPGIAIPIETRSDSRSVLFYLSFEHPFVHARPSARNSTQLR